MPNERVGNDGTAPHKRARVCECLWGPKGHKGHPRAGNESDKQLENPCQCHVAECAQNRNNNNTTGSQKQQQSQKKQQEGARDDKETDTVNMTKPRYTNTFCFWNKDIA